MGFTKVYDYSQCILAAILAVVYVLILCRIKRGTNYTFVIRLITLLLLSNVALIAQILIWQYMQSNWAVGSNTVRQDFVLVAQSVAEFIRDFCFNTAHWIFAFEYYTISKTMPYVLRGEDIPEKAVSQDAKLYTVFLFLNILAPLLEGIFLFEANLACLNEKLDAQHNFSLFLTISRSVMAFLLIISGFYLGCALSKIHQYLLKNAGRTSINIKILIIHSCLFLVYLISSVILLVATAFYYF